MSEVVRERGTSGATFEAVVIMITGGFGILKGRVEHPLARVNALDTSRWRTHGHEHRSGSSSARLFELVPADYVRFVRCALAFGRGFLRS